MNNKKFSIGDKIIIKRDRCYNYGLCLGLSGEITTIGMKREGKNTYLAKINGLIPVEIRVWEQDIEGI